MKRSQINAYIKANYLNKSDEVIAKKCGITVNAVQCRRYEMNLKRTDELDPATAIMFEKRLTQSRKDRAADKKKKEYLIEENESLKADLEAALEIKGHIRSHKIKAPKSSGGEATMVAVASDWHIEETVNPEQVNGLNEYNLDVSQRRADQYFKTLLKLTEIEGQHTKINHIVLALLGDFISSNIHEELLETTAIPPIEATIRAQEYIVSGINYLLDNSDYKITAVCHSGNHGRITRTVHHGTEAGNSLEYMMYKSIASHFRDEKRIEFIIPNAYHSYLEVYDKTIRFHHGHAIRYGGGVGGVTIPVNKAIAQWNRSRTADIDVFGHFHQAYDGGSFICNGSMIGFNAYAVSIKAAFERPVQMAFCVHSKLGHYVTRRIYFEDA